ncbi:uncharacterized protein [Amphiura filiformis]|uniref:uncharacterized protein n=1 Tax=Amphiura filiformis TaxID=82378 RepID=UPI003B2155B6
MSSPPRKLSFIDRKASNSSMSSTQSLTTPRRRSSVSNKFSFDGAPSGTGRKMSGAGTSLPAVSTTGRKMSMTGVNSRRPSLTGRGNLPPPLSRKPSNSSLKSGPPSPGRPLKFAIPENRQSQASKLIGFKQLLVTKRFARNLKLRTSQRLADKRGYSYVTYMDKPRRKTLTSSRVIIRLEPTYKIEPREKFALYHPTIKSIMESIVEASLKYRKYDSLTCASLTQQLSGDIQAEVKDIELERYRLITVVNIGERNRQDVRIVSRAIWDPDLDSFVTYKFQNEWLFCIATVYGIYLE